MKNLKNHKKSGFTLTEVALAVLIVGLLLALTLPILRNVLQKSDEYSYYLAYRTVEKIGGQIVALGDPTDTFYNTQADDKIKVASLPRKSLKHRHIARKSPSLFDSLSSRFAYTENFLLKKFIPKAFAASWVQEASWDSEEFNEMKLTARVCKGEKIEKGKDPQTNEPVYYTREDVGGDATCTGIAESTDSNEGDFADSFNFDDAVCGDNRSQIRNILTSESGTAEQVCNLLKTNCAKSVGSVEAYPNKEFKVEMKTTHTDAGVDEDGEYSDAEDVTECYFYSKESESYNNSNDSVNIIPPNVTDICKPEYGYYGMYNSAAPYALTCECSSGKIESYNNDKVCCTQKANLNAYARTDIYPGMPDSLHCVYCPSNRDFNPVANRCCPTHSVFNGTTCEPVEGFGNCDQNVCHRTKCSKGLHYDAETETCIINPPIVKAKKLCELIASNWNVSSSYCSPFTGEPAVYKAVFDAATGTNGRYLSIASKSGFFATAENPISPDLTRTDLFLPNIVMANGLYVWILGDKAASIPGLSYSPVGINATKNMCIELKSGSNPIASAETCKAAGGYSCKGEGHCYTLPADSLTSMGDARNCCASADISDISYQTGYEKDNRVYAVNGFTIFVDINGPKGSGTLWEDVFPFFVSANGTVYPGYPIDAPKGRGDNVPNGLYLGGNNVSNLAVDVFYYENINGGAARKKVSVFPNVSFARGICYSRKIGELTPYCQNLGLKAKNSGNAEDDIKSAITNSSNKCNSHNCHISVRNKIKFF